jgi:hypothetical protein
VLHPCQLFQINVQATCDDLGNDPFGALPIEFTVEEARPAAEVDPAIGDGQDDLVMRASGF